MSEKGLIVLLFAAFFVASIAGVVIAENDSDTGNNASDISNATGNNTSNMTFGKCVAEAAKLRQGCYGEDKNTSKLCVDAAKPGKNKTQAKQCVSDYKTSIKSCKTSFKEAKKTCIQIYKPGFWERMRYFFK